MDLLEEIRRDIVAFADPGSGVLISNDGAMWEQDGEEISVSWSRPQHGGFPDVVMDGVRGSYFDFLAGPRMADMNRFAEFIKKTMILPSHYVETNAIREAEDGNRISGSATDIVASRATCDLPFRSTRVVLVQGEAGSGKTVSLRQMTVLQAEKYLRKDAHVLFFYVDAQGRALSRLEEAMAKDLQDLRSRFSYAAIAPLTRRGLLVPVIDGFDELLGSGGYDEAFSSLAAFLSTLGGSGAVIASARSAFFDYRNFYENAEKFSRDGSLNYAVEPIQIEPWTDEQLTRFIATTFADRGRSGDDTEAKFSAFFGSLDDNNKALLAKPFYVARIAEILLEGTDLSTDEALLDQLVDAFIRREHLKMLDKERHPLLSEKGHRSLLVQLAEEMWWQESRRLDVASVQAVAEMVTEEFGLPPWASKSIVERVSSYAFLTTADSEKRRLRFEHEVFYGYFLAYKLQGCIEREPADLRRFLNRSVLDDILAEQSVRLIGRATERCSRAVESICDVLRAALSDVVARENAGLLISLLIQSAGGLRDGICIRNVIFRRCEFGNSMLKGVVFSNCDFDTVDLTKSRLIDPKFESCAVYEMIIDPTCTRLDYANSSLVDQVQSVVVKGEGGALPSGRYFAPNDIASVLRQIGMQDAGRLGPVGSSETVRDRIERLERFLNKMQRRFYVTYEEIERFPFAHGDKWKRTWKLLEKHGLISEELRQKSGPREPLIRLAYPPEVIRGGEDVGKSSTPEPVRAFWRDFVVE